jgi:hypothetical protein
MASGFTIQAQAINTVRVFMVSVETQFVSNPQQDQYAAGHADGKTRNIDQGIGFLTFDVS